MVECVVGWEERDVGEESEGEVMRDVRERLDTEGE